MVKRLVRSNLKDWRVGLLALLLIGVICFVTLNNLVYTNHHSLSAIKVPRDHGSIQAAIKAVKEGGTIFVSPGSYQENLFINKTLTLKTDKKEPTVIDGKRGNKYGLPTIFVSASSNVTIDGFTIKNGYSGIRLEDCTNITISSNLITNNLGRGIFVLGSNKVDLKNNQITKTVPFKTDILGTGIDLKDSSEVTFSNLLISQNANIGIRLSSSSVELNKAKINHNSSVGLLAKNDSTVILSDSELVGNQNIGILITSSSKAGITNSLISKTRSNPKGELGIGIGIETDSQATLLKNTISANENYGILLLSKATAKIQENKIIENKLDGIHVTEQSTAEIAGNRIIKNVFAGIHIANQSKAIINRNNIMDNLPTGDGKFGRGINVRAKSTTSITKNTISENAEDGISVFDSSATIEENTIKGNVNCGIFADKDSSITGHTNQITDNGEDLCGDISSAIKEEKQKKEE